MQYILFNPLANNNSGEQTVREYLKDLEGEAEYIDVTALGDLRGFISGVSQSDRVILAGGDGTINRFVNALGDVEPPCDIDYVPTGSGNDFAKDLGVTDRFIKLNGYIKNLPTVTVKGESYKFINGIGYGIDGYCCEVGDELKKRTDKPINYASIAVKGLLFHFKRPNATVIVDGEEHSFKKVWLAPTMKGRYYGGGMNVAPAQDRNAPDGKLSLVVMHKAGKLKTLMVFPSIFKGEHIKHTEMVSVFTGHEFTVRFDRPTALQIDGETVLAVSEYSVSAK